MRGKVPPHTPPHRFLPNSSGRAQFVDSSTTTPTAHMPEAARGDDRTMSRFETFVVSNRRDAYGIPRTTGSLIVNLDEISSVSDATVDTTYRASFDERCPAGIFAGVRVSLRSGETHTLMLGQFATTKEADSEVDDFTRWLTGMPLLVD